MLLASFLVNPGWCSGVVLVGMGLLLVLLVVAGSLVLLVQLGGCSLCFAQVCLPWPRVGGQSQVLIIVSRSLRWHLVLSVARPARSSPWVARAARGAWYLGRVWEVAAPKVFVAWRLAFIFTFAWIITPAWLRPMVDLRITLVMAVMIVVMMVNWMLLVVAYVTLVMNI